MATLISTTEILDRYDTRIFESLPHVLKSTATLVRISRLDQILVMSYPLSGRNDAVAKIIALWAGLYNQVFETFDLALAARSLLIGPIRDTEAASEPPSPRTPSETTSSRRTFISRIDRGSIGRKYNPRISDFYQGIMKPRPATIEEFLETIAQAIRDLNSVQFNPPAIKSQRGNKGPTLIVNYRRIFTDPTHSYTQAHILKWTDRNEIFMNKIYDLLSRDLSDAHHSAGFRVPSSGGIDLDNHVYLRPNGEVDAISPELSLQLERDFASIRNIYSPPHTCPPTCARTKTWMISEKIPGANLLDFATRKYRELELLSQKLKFFTRLGRIAMLDLITGNLDRLIQIVFTDGQYKLEIMEANLGNIMVVFSGGLLDPVPYAIDNGIDPELASNPENQAKYATFLAEILSPSTREEKIAIIAHNIIESFIHALNTQPDECSGNAAEIRKQLTNFSEDLKDFGFKAIQTGLCQMCEKLDSRLLEIWNQPSWGALKAQITELCSTLLTSLENRFKIFEQIRSI